MSGSVKTDAIVLRSLRFGEADRILHLYTPLHGRIGAIAKGVRRARSRFGARLLPFVLRSLPTTDSGLLVAITAPSRDMRVGHEELQACDREFMILYLMQVYEQF